MPLGGGNRGAVCARLLVYLVVFWGLSADANAGGVAYVAGASSFDPTVKGSPITWAGGQISYFTDQGDLSPVLLHADADAFVQQAFSTWTSVTTAALFAQKSGELAEDVNGTNVGSAGSLSLPADIQPSATDKPIAIVYDSDGAVTDALLGSGADLDCAANAVTGGPDSFSFDGHFAHALLVINGLCAQNSSQLPALKYRLMRAIGRALGLGWSQLNDNVITGSADSNDYSGFPLMHPVDPSCDPLACLPDALSLRMDDRAAISRLYPVTAANLADFTGKQILQQQTIRIHGSAYFRLGAAGTGQPMQGVNVVARWIDPTTGIPSRSFASSSVSGYLFRGNAGNAVTGFTDGQGLRFDRFGSDDPNLEGAFDLEGLELPPGYSTGDFEISVEPINPDYTGGASVGPYSTAQVNPSGSFAPLILHNLAPGDDVVQDIVMQDSSAVAHDSFEPNAAANMTHVPPGGEWTGSLSGYGDEDYFLFSAKADHSFAFQVEALNESGQVINDKARPALGLWQTDTTSGPIFMAPAFNTAQPGATRLNEQILQDGDYILGIAEERGDGRPDFQYHARLLYLEDLSSSRTPLNTSEILRVRAAGVRKEAVATVGGVAAPILSAGSDEVFLQSPGLGAGVYTLQISDGGLSAQILKAVTVGTVASDVLTLVSSANPVIADGSITPNPIIVQVKDAAGQPLSGIPVTFSVSPTSSIITACNASACSVNSDETGKASIQVWVKTNSTHTITASLSNGQSVLASLGTRASSLDIQALDPTVRAASGANVAVPLTARVLNLGLPVVGRQVVYRITSGSGTLSSSTPVTDSSGDASVTFTSSGFASGASVSACVDGVSPCASFSLVAVAASAIQLEVIAGGGQILKTGTAAVPIQVTSTDSSGNPVLGAPVQFEELAWRPSESGCIPGNCRPGGIIVLYSGGDSTVSNRAGISSYSPYVEAAWGAAQVSIHITAGSSSTDVPIRIIENMP